MLTLTIAELISCTFLLGMSIKNLVNEIKEFKNIG